MPVFLIARFKKAEIVCHLVGSDIENFIKSLNFLEKHIIVFCLHGIKRWVVLGDNMKNQIINVYEYLNIQEKLDIDFVIAEGFISDELNEHVKNEMIEKKVATFGNSLNIGYMSN